MTYIKKLAVYVSYLAAVFGGFAQDAETSAQVLGKDLDRIHIQNEASHRSLAQEKDMEWGHGTVYGDIRTTVELSQKRTRYSTVTTLKTQVSKI